MNKERIFSRLQFHFNVRSGTMEPLWSYPVPLTPNRQLHRDSQLSSGTLKIALGINGPSVPFFLLPTISRHVKSEKSHLVLDASRRCDRVTLYERMHVLATCCHSSFVSPTRDSSGTRRHLEDVINQKFISHVGPEPWYQRSAMPIPARPTPPTVTRYPHRKLTHPRLPLRGYCGSASAHPSPPSSVMSS